MRQQRRAARARLKWGHARRPSAPFAVCPAGASLDCDLDSSHLGSRALQVRHLVAAGQCAAHAGRVGGGAVSAAPPGAGALGRALAGLYPSMLASVQWMNR